MATLVFQPLSYIGIISKLHLSNVPFCSWPRDIELLFKITYLGAPR